MVDQDTRERLLLLQQKVDNHIDEFHEHRNEYKAYREEEAERWDHLLMSQAENARAISDMAEASRDMLTAWEAATGAVKVLSAFGKFIKWLGTFTFIGAFFTWLITHFGGK